MGATTTSPVACPLHTLHPGNDRVPIVLVDGVSFYSYHSNIYEASVSLHSLLQSSSILSYSIFALSKGTYCSVFSIPEMRSDGPFLIRRVTYRLRFLSVGLLYHPSAICQLFAVGVVYCCRSAIFNHVQPCHTITYFHSFLHTFEPWSFFLISNISFTSAALPAIPSKF
ncbi:hypothetical protein BKA63DRAFT_193186 [Paraphoma chrysanthemicola]|nr:hypothetical protein BKA63DRAFT_193186 [Paraphoma chrysanthemicola]